MEIVQPRARRRVLAAVAVVALAAGSGASCSRFRPGGGGTGSGSPRPSWSMPSGGGVPGGGGQPGGGQAPGGGGGGADHADDHGGAPGGDDHGGGMPGMDHGGAAPGTGGGTPGGGGGALPGGGTAECPNVEIVTARGTGESQTSARGLSGLNDGIASQVPGTKIYQVVYPATADFMGSAAQGTKDTLAHISAKSAQCANTRFFLTGYSQGGMVLTGVLQQLPANLQPKILGGVMYGNPYYKGNSPSAQGPDKAAKGIIPTGIPASYGDKFHDYCMTGDTVCGSGAQSGSVGLPSSGISSAHMTYPRSQLEKGAITWAVGLIKAS